MTGTVGLLLAAGAGRRAGGPKALRRGPDGRTWLERAASVLLDGGCAEVLVVLGAVSEEAQGVLAARVEPRVMTLVCPDWSTGMAASLRSGLAALVRRDPAAVLVHLVDLPDVGADVVARVLEAGHGSTPLARASYAGVPGHPVLLGARHLPALVHDLVGDRGAQAYLARYDVTMVECGDLATGLDQDGPPVTVAGARA